MARVSSVQCYARRTRVSLASSVIRESVRCGAVPCRVADVMASVSSLSRSLSSPPLPWRPTSASVAGRSSSTPCCYAPLCSPSSPRTARSSAPMRTLSITSNCCPTAKALPLRLRPRPRPRKPHLFAPHAGLHTTTNHLLHFVFLSVFCFLFAYYLHRLYCSR